MIIIDLATKSLFDMQNAFLDKSVSRGRKLSGWEMVFSVLFEKRMYMKDLFAKIVGRRNFQKKPPEGEEYVNIVKRMSVKYLSK